LLLNTNNFSHSEAFARCPHSSRPEIVFAILRGANGRRHEVDFEDDPVIVDVSMSPTTVEITMTATDPGDPAKGRYVT
jgi:hypothetical protein